MMNGYRFTLMVQISSGDDTDQPYVKADVQVYRGDELLAIHDMVPMDLSTPRFHDAESLEQFATHASRRVARYIDERLQEKIEMGEELGTVENLEKWYPRASDSTQTA